MAQPAEALPSNYDAPKKDLYEIGEIPPMGHVPEKMYAWTIRRERHGEPDTAMQVEAVPTHKIDSHEVLVLVMAAGVNYNGVWASLGIPISPFDVHKADFHIAGSDASGIVWAVGSKVKRFKLSVSAAWMHLICALTTESTSTGMRLNSSKQPHAPVWTRPE